MWLLVLSVVLIALAVASYILYFILKRDVLAADKDTKDLLMKEIVNLRGSINETNCVLENHKEALDIQKAHIQALNAKVLKSDVKFVSLNGISGFSYSPKGEESINEFDEKYKTDIHTAAVNCLSKLLDCSGISQIPRWDNIAVDEKSCEVLEEKCQDTPNFEETNANSANEEVTKQAEIVTQSPNLKSDILEYQATNEINIPEEKKVIDLSEAIPLFAKEDIIEKEEPQVVGNVTKKKEIVFIQKDEQINIHRIIIKDLGNEENSFAEKENVDVDAEEENLPEEDDHKVPQALSEDASASEEDLEHDDERVDLDSLNLKELKEIAKKFNVSANKKKAGKTIAKSKEELIVSLKRIQKT